MTPAGQPNQRIPILAKSRIGKAVTGYWTKTFVARAEPVTHLELRLPSRLLKGRLYLVRIEVTGPGGEAVVVMKVLGVS